jgi:uncharacterized membrane protein
MEVLIQYLLSGLGITLLLTKSKIISYIKPHRNFPVLGYFSRCTQCNSFWVGILLDVYVFNLSPYNPVIYACMLSGFAHSIVSIYNKGCKRC